MNDYVAIARELRASHAKTDAVLKRLRRTEQLVIGRSSVEMARDRIIAAREGCERMEQLAKTLEQWFKIALAELRA